MNKALLIIVEVLPVRDFVIGIAILRIGLDELVTMVDLSDIPVHLIYKHTGEICFYQ